MSLGNPSQVSPPPLLPSPPQGANKGFQVCRKKMGTGSDVLCQRVHTSFQEFTDAVINLKFEEEPPYQKWVGGSLGREGEAYVGWGPYLWGGPGQEARLVSDIGGSSPPSRGEGCYCINGVRGRRLGGGG